MKLHSFWQEKKIKNSINILPIMKNYIIEKKPDVVMVLSLLVPIGPNVNDKLLESMLLKEIEVFLDYKFLYRISVSLISIPTFYV